MSAHRRHARLDEEVELQRNAQASCGQLIRLHSTTQEPTLQAHTAAQQGTWSAACRACPAACRSAPNSAVAAASPGPSPPCPAPSRPSAWLAHCWPQAPPPSHPPPAWPAAEAQQAQDSFTISAWHVPAGNSNHHRFSTKSRQQAHWHLRVRSTHLGGRGGAGPGLHRLKVVVRGDCRGGRGTESGSQQAKTSQPTSAASGDGPAPQQLQQQLTGDRKSPIWVPGRPTWLGLDLGGNQLPQLVRGDGPGRCRPCCTCCCRACCSCRRCRLLL